MASLSASRARTSRAILIVVALLLALALLPAAAGAQEADPRVGLGAGWLDAEEAAAGMELLAHVDRPEGFVDPASPGNLNLANSDLAFSGDHAFVGSFHGFTVYDISEPTDPQLVVAVVCPGGQGDVSVFGDLLLMSVEQTRGRVDCGAQGVTLPADAARFRGVRVFDISDIANPRQVAAVQTCRGSHTHTLVTDPDDDATLWVYSSGTAASRSPLELSRCNDVGGTTAAGALNPFTAHWSIDVIEVPLDRPQDARWVSSPRVFAGEDGRVNGLWGGGNHGAGTQTTRITDQCHDITAYPEIGLAAGACSGNGILLDITDPADPVRVDDVIDPNFAYWHSATFNDAGTKVVFTDEWGGGTGARCRDTDRREWGANAIFDIVDGRLELASYYKLPVPQTAQENCVAHNGSLIPVPGRDIMVQAWYQGGTSVFDFTDSANPFEIAYFDRGPIAADRLVTGGFWSTYWYNGHLYGSEIARGFDVFALTPTPALSADEIAAASAVRVDELNAQHQQRIRR
jgi:hypothetical protein